MKFKRQLIALMLKVLNSRFFNSSPCEYGYINNVDAFSMSNLKSEVFQCPDVTVAEIIRDAERFKSCPLRPDSVMVIEPDGAFHEATAMDIHQLHRDFAPKPPKEGEHVHSFNKPPYGSTDLRP